MKNRILALASLLLVSLLAGCNSAAQLNNVRIGMSKDQVITLLGTPDSTSAQANVEYLTYYLEGDSTYGRDRPYMVRVVDGKVESFGRFAQLSDLYYRPVTSARAGDANFPTQPYPSGVAPMGAMPTPAAAAPASDLATQLEKLKALLDQGVLTADEFQRAKAKLLSDQK
jgi:hypothetical protein